MSLKPPGSASTIVFLWTAVWVTLMLIGLVAGHVVLLVYIYVSLDQDVGMQALATQTGLPIAALWASVGVSLLLDIWILLHDRKNKEQVRRR